MPDLQRCPVCGAPHPIDAPEGFCPRCSFSGALRANLEEQQPAAGSPSSEPAANSAGGFGDYDLLEEIAQGGMGIVYRARQRSLDRIVAVKLLLFGSHATPEAVKRFRAEAVAAAALQHPNIVAIHEVGIRDGQHFIVMDYIEGRNLSALIHGQPLPAQRAARYVQLIAEAIHFAHEHGILHRDLKPSNILIDLNDQPHLTDFGLAKRLSGDTHMTLTGQVLGSPSYIPPEQAMGRPSQVSRGSDVYALGALLFHALAGRPPFVGESVAETLQHVLNDEPVSPRLLNPGVPRDLETICLKCLEKEPSRRYHTAQALADELARFQKSEPIQARPLSAGAKLWRWCRRKPQVASAIGVAVLSLVIGQLGAIWQWRQAVAQRVRAEVEELRARRNAYAADINLAQRALAENDVGLALRLLNKHRPTTGGQSASRNPPAETDLRGWEWRYLWQLSQPDRPLRLPTHSILSGPAFLSQNGRVMAVRAGTNRIEVWDLASKQLLKGLSGFRSARILGLSPDGGLMALRREEVPVIEVWDVGAGARRATLDHASMLRSLAFSQNGRSLVSFDHHSSNAIVRVVDWTTNRTLTEFTVGPPRGGRMGVVAFSPDGNRLAVEEDRGTILVVRWLTGSVVRIPTQTTDGVTALAFSPDGKLLAAGFAYASGTIRLWDADSGEFRGQLTNHTRWVRALAFSPDGQRLASASQDRTIRLWSLADQTELRRFQGHFVEALSFLPDGQTLVSGGEDGSVCFWNSTSNAVNRTSGPVKLAISPAARVRGAPVTRFGVAFTPDSRSFITTDTNGSLALWDAKAMQPTEPLPELGTNNWGVALSPDGRWLAAGDTRGQIHIWDWRGRRRVRSLEMPFEWSGFLRFSRSGSFLWTWVWFNDHTLKARMWRTGDWDQVPLIPLQQARIMSVDLSPDERHLATGSADGWVKLWSFPGGQLEATFPQQVGWVFGIRFSRDGSVLVSSGGGGTARLRDVATHRELEPLVGHLGGPWGIAFSPDGRRLATGGGDTRGGRAQDAVKLWDWTTRRELLTFPGDGQFFTDLTFSPDGNTLVAACLDGVTHFWRAPSWEDIAAAEKGEAVP